MNRNDWTVAAIVVIVLGLLFLKSVCAGLTYPFGRPVIVPVPVKPVPAPLKPEPKKPC